MYRSLVLWRRPHVTAAKTRAEIFEFIFSWYIWVMWWRWRPYFGSMTSPVTDSRVPPLGSLGPSPRRPLGMPPGPGAEIKNQKLLRKFIKHTRVTSHWFTAKDFFKGYISEIRIRGEPAHRNAPERPVFAREIHKNTHYYQQNDPRLFGSINFTEATTCWKIMGSL